MRMTKAVFRTVALLGVALFSVAQTADAATVNIESPSGKVRVHISDESGHLIYKVTADGKDVLAASPLGIRTNATDVGQHSVITKVKRGKVAETYRLYGVKRFAEHKANTATLSLRDTGSVAFADVQVADDGVAVRLRLPAQTGRKVEADLSGWRPSDADATMWVSELKEDYENPYYQSRLSQLTGKRLGAPITLKINGLWVTLTEAAVRDYADSAVGVSQDGLLLNTLYANPEGWTTDAAVIQPWRVTIIARTLTELVNSTLVQNVNPAPSAALARADWIKPGRSTWQWLAIGDPLEDDQPQWVDWTKTLGYEYYLIDDGWAKWKQPWPTLEKTVRYAREKGVGIWVWVHSREVFEADARRSFFKRLADAGVVGVKIDFPEPGSRVWSNWYEDAARDAAASRLMVDFHGAIKPSGTERTWPNVLTREGVRGHEWHITRYNRKLPAAHDTILPFTRYVAGPGDYTPTVFTPKELQGNTWSHELAQMVMFTSPFLSFGGHPQTYISNPAFGVIKDMPAVWDETRVLAPSQPGEVAALARRSGEVWYIAVINNETPRSARLKLDFLTPGKWQIENYADDRQNPAAFITGKRHVAPGESLDITLSPQGGYVARIRRQ